MIAVDDMNDWVGCLSGHPDVITPNYDRRAIRGLLFTNALVAASVFNPSLVATLTGLRPSPSPVSILNDDKAHLTLLAALLLAPLAELHDSE